VGLMGVNFSIIVQACGSFCLVVTIRSREYVVTYDESSTFI